MEQEEEKKRTKLKKQESFREVQESIKKFENKKEFVEVKLKTRQSFREDQEALNRRFKTKASRKMQSDSVENGHEDSLDNGGPSKVDSILLDLSQENGDKMENLSGNNNQGHINNGYVDESPDINGVHVNDTSERRENKQEESETRETRAVGNKSRIDQLHLPNGHVRGAMTPEPRLKAKGRLYEKNDKLAASNSSHLDRISLKGSKHHLINGFR